MIAIKPEFDRLIEIYINSMTLQKEAIRVEPIRDHLLLFISLFIYEYSHEQYSCQLLQINPFFYFKLHLKTSKLH